MSEKEQIELLNMVIATQASRIEEQQKTIEELRVMIEELRSLKAGLEETLDEFKRKFFGISSEKTSKEKADNTASSKEKIKVKEHVRERNAKSKRKDMYAGLPVEEVIIPVDEEHRYCEWCNSEMIPVKPTYVREELRITPAVIERIHYYQEVLVCPECRKDGDGSFIKATVPSALIPHSPASASAVAYVMFHKSFMSTPYYRQEAALEQLGAKIPRETLANWYIRCAESHLLPIYERLHEELIKRAVIHADETTCQVLREEGRMAEATSYMWIYTSGSDGLAGIVMYEYQPGRSGIYPQEFLKGFEGLLQCDGYQGYNKVNDVLLVCCAAHCRRKFFEAVPKERKKGLKLLDINSVEVIREPEIPSANLDKYIPAEIGVAYCNKLFYLERKYKYLSPEERKQKRLEEESPVWENFLSWLDTLNPTKGSKLEKAVNYAQNHRDTLRNYMLDGRCELSNNAAERKAKRYAISRKNSLFHTSVAGATTSAIVYSLIETAKANNLNVFQYLYILLLYMPDYRNEPAGIEQLMPWSDFIKEHCSGVIDVETITAESHPELTF